jgi:hypothetical protein
MMECVPGHHPFSLLPWRSHHLLFLLCLLGQLHLRYCFLVTGDQAVLSRATCAGVGSQMGEQHVQEKQEEATWPASRLLEQEMATLQPLLWERYSIVVYSYTVVSK